MGLRARVAPSRPHRGRSTPGTHLLEGVGGTGRAGQVVLQDVCGERSGGRVRPAACVCLVCLRARARACVCLRGVPGCVRAHVRGDVASESPGPAPRPSAPGSVPAARTAVSWVQPLSLPSLWSSRQGTGGRQGVRRRPGMHLLGGHLGRVIVLRPEHRPKEEVTQPIRCSLEHPGLGGPGCLIALQTGVDSASDVRRWGFTYGSDAKNPRRPEPGCG